PEKRAAASARAVEAMNRPDVKARVAAAKLDERNPNWHGDRVEYSGLHGWGKRRLPRPTACSACGAVGKVDLANKSQEYQRNLSDWEWLCRLCHMTKDGRRDALIQRNAAAGGA